MIWLLFSLWMGGGRRAMPVDDSPSRRVRLPARKRSQEPYS